MLILMNVSFQLQQQKENAHTHCLLMFIFRNQHKTIHIIRWTTLVNLFSKGIFQ